MKKYDFDPQKYINEITSIVTELLNADLDNQKNIDKILKKYPKDKNEIFSRDQLIAGIKFLESSWGFPSDDLERLVARIRMKPTRTISGVTTVTVLTKPFACPGQCVFCPNDVRMPKSYIATEPGAQRALMNRFSPYLQVYNRLKALKNIGHPTEKIELLILGGTWVYYPKKYQIWFIYECFRAMNDFGEDKFETKDEPRDITEDLKSDYNEELRNEIGDKPYNQLIVTQKFKQDFKDKVVADPSNLSVMVTCPPYNYGRWSGVEPRPINQPHIDEVTWSQLFAEQDKNSKGKVRCVGLVLETRPDTINPESVLDLRKLGATKIQLGIQTLDDEISKLNKRGENKADTAKAFELLRAGGFKIHGHIMPNLYGSTPEIDFRVYKELFDSEEFKPDELKIYPTSVIKHTELYDYWQAGKYSPYSTNELAELLANSIEYTPQYCRLTRIIRDIPSTEIETGNKVTNLREIVERKLKQDRRVAKDIHSREIRNEQVKFEDLVLDEVEYKTKRTTEKFLQFVVADPKVSSEARKIAGFLRLSLPNEFKNPITNELDDCAIIREVHVYGPSLELSKDSNGQAQHLGLGTKLIERAKEITKEKGYKKLAVISAIGTREYYQKRGFELTGVYQVAIIQ